MSTKPVPRFAWVYLGLLFTLCGVSLLILTIQLSKNAIEILVKILELVGEYK